MDGETTAIIIIIILEGVAEMCREAVVIQIITIIINRTIKGGETENIYKNLTNSLKTPHGIKIIRRIIAITVLSIRAMILALPLIGSKQEMKQIKISNVVPLLICQTSNEV